MKFVLILLLLSGAVLAQKYLCYTRHYFANVCYHFEFKGDCQPYQLQLCKAIRITRSDFRCPRYFCVS